MNQTTSRVRASMGRFWWAGHLAAYVVFAAVIVVALW